MTVWNDVTEEVWMFMKEISSDGDVSTVSQQACTDFHLDTLICRLRNES